jgi:hypothetical protein
VDGAKCDCSCNAWKTALPGKGVSLRESLLASLAVTQTGLSQGWSPPTAR